MESVPISLSAHQAAFVRVLRRNKMFRAHLDVHSGHVTSIPPGPWIKTLRRPLSTSYPFVVIRLDVTSGKEWKRDVFKYFDAGAEDCRQNAQHKCVNKGKHVQISRPRWVRKYAKSCSHVFCASWL